LGFTPMIQQYLKIKSKYPDAILFFRLGDFYEMFFEDAIVASAILDIALTAREGGKAKIPMCGIPHHAYEGYAAKLLGKGHKVAICEQMEEPKQGKGIVHREVIRVITPGTILDEKILNEKANNYLAALVKYKNNWGLSYADISTGEFGVAEFITNRASVLEELSRLKPAEVLLPSNLQGEFLLAENIKQLGAYINWQAQDKSSRGGEIGFFKENLGKSFEIKEELLLRPLAVKAGYMLLKYLLDTQKQSLDNFTSLKLYNPGNFMIFDGATRRNLELSENLQTKSVKGSLLGVLDETGTSMGARKLRQWLEAPLVDLNKIRLRLDTVEELVSNSFLREKIRIAIKGIYDLERLLSRVSYGTANARDLLALKNSIKKLPEIFELLSLAKSQNLKDFSLELDLLPDIYELLEKSILEEAATNIREGNFIKNGFHPEADKLRKATQEGKQWIAALEKKEREQTGIRSLKVGYNKVFGYYIEVTKANLDLIPDYYDRKQTLANAERFTTPELKEMESLILGAEERLSFLEYELFQEIGNQIKKNAGRIQKSANLIAELDAYLSLAIVATKNNYYKPEILPNQKIELVGARHPVVEQLVKDPFVENDLVLGPPEKILNIITGPNMAGKSTYIRAAALICIMAQMGSFVPATSAKIGVQDRIFARVGASDDLSTGQSTFMVEMNEVANILRLATNRSLIILDEVGRGTSTFDGISIAWAISEFIIEKIKAKTLFATHYHELSSLADKYPSVNNFSMSVQEKGQSVIFLRKVLPGSADRSYGIHVAELAGLPSELIKNAYKILNKLESKKIKAENGLTSEITENLPDLIEEDVLFKELKSFFYNISAIDLNNLTPIEALQIFVSLQMEAETIEKLLWRTKE